MSRSALLSTAVFGLLLLLVLGTRDDRVSVGLRSLELPELATQDVSRVAIAGPVSAILERSGDEWSVEDPATPGTRHPVEKQQIERLLRSISELEAGSFVSDRVDKHAELEIDEASGTRVEITSTGGAVLDLMIGRRAKNGGDLLRLRDSDAVFVAQGELASSARRDAKSWRRRRVVDVEATAITRLKIEVPGEAPFVLERDASDGASFALAAGTTLPPGYGLDAGAAGRIAGALAGLRADEFVDEDPGLEVTGLDDRETRVEAFDASGATLAVVRFGGVVAEERVHMRMDADPQLYLVSRTRVDTVAPSLARLRDLSLASVDASQVSGVSIRHGTERVEVAKRDGGWELLQPDPPPPGYTFDAAAVDARVSAVTRTRGTRFLGLEAEVGADFSDSVDVTLQLADGNTRTVVFGGVLEGAENSGSEEVAVKPGNGFIYAVRRFERRRYEEPLKLFEFVPQSAAPPGGGGMQGLENLPPDVRRQIEQQLRDQGAR